MVTPGSCASVGFVVDEPATAIALGSGDVPVLGTPKVVALCEQAAVAAVAGVLDSTLTTVGTQINLDHVAPSPIGASVVATATVVAADDRRIEFIIEVTQEDRVVATGTHHRAIVNRARFLPNP